jgi:hypothetical protein
MDAEERRILTEHMSNLLQENGVDTQHVALFVDFLSDDESTDKLVALCETDPKARTVLNALIDARIQLALELFKDES